MSADPTTVTATGNGASEPTSEVMLADGRVMSARDAPIGGQAVLEGVMMRGVSTWAVAVRVPHDLALARASGNGASHGDGTGDHHHHLAEEAEVALEAAATTLAGAGPASGNGAVGVDGERSPPRILRQGVEHELAP